MTPHEIGIFRQMLTDVLGSHMAEIKGELEIMKHDIVHIKEQTYKTNGRVNRHDTAIAELEKDKHKRESVFLFMRNVAIAVVAFLGLLLTIKELLI